MPLVFRQVSSISHETSGGQLVVGAISKDKFSGNRDRWSWFLSAVTGPSSVMMGQGFRDGFDDCNR